MACDATRGKPSGTGYVRQGRTSKDLQWWGLQEGCEVQAGAGEEAAEQGGPVLHPLEPGLDQRSQLGDVAFGQVGQGPFEVGPDQLDGVELVGIRREPVDGQPVPGGDQLGHRRTDVRIEVVPHNHERAAELLRHRRTAPAADHPAQCRASPRPVTPGCWTPRTSRGGPWGPLWPRPPGRPGRRSPHPPGRSSHGDAGTGPGS
jgi:hypothetical protein